MSSRPGPEIAALARTGTSVAHCPVSNLKLGCGIAPVPRLLSAGVTVGLGTDGAVSSNTLDVLGAVRQAALVHKAVGDPTAVGAERAVRMATIEGPALWVSAITWAPWSRASGRI